MENKKIKNVITAIKKIVSFILIVLMSLMLCSCGVKITKTDNTISTTVSETKAKTTENLTQNSITTAKVKETSAKTITTEMTTATTEKSTEKQVVCTVEISCESILANTDKLKENKREFLPEDGSILKSVNVTVAQGKTAFDVIKKVCSENVCEDNCKYCRNNGIQLDYVFTPGYDSYYIRGIHQIYEKDCGSQSGWMYCVNDEFPNCGCSQYKVKNGDVIKFIYTCNSGDDLNTDS